MLATICATLVVALPATASAITPRTALFGVSCTSTKACTAVGTHESGGLWKPADDVWTGTEWKFEELEEHLAPQLDSLEGVSCVAANQCWAVGSGGTTSWILKQEGLLSWSLDEKGPKHPLSSVSCTTIEACEAVGGPARLSGKLEWTEQTASGNLRGVSCTAANACTAVGQTSTGEKTVADRWNGTAWTLQTTANPGTADYLKSVSCTSATACVAVGWSGETSKTMKPLAEKWNGTEWKAQTVPNPTKGGQLLSVSCNSEKACMAVGAIGTEKAEGTLSEVWNGTEWKIKTTPAGEGLYGVSCPESAYCEAVGSHPGFNSEASVWNGTEWKAQETPGM